MRVVTTSTTHFSAGVERIAHIVEGMLIATDTAGDMRLPHDLVMTPNTKLVRRCNQLSWLGRGMGVMTDGTVTGCHGSMHKSILLEIVDFVDMALAAQGQFFLGHLPALRFTFAIVAVATLESPLRTVDKFLFEHPYVTGRTRIILSSGPLQLSITRVHIVARGAKGFLLRDMQGKWLKTFGDNGDGII